MALKKRDSITPQVIDSLCKYVGYKKVKLTADNKIIKQNPNIKPDCSAIAKGYGYDVVAGLFNRLGIKNYMIEIGGEIVAKGLTTSTKHGM